MRLRFAAWFARVNTKMYRISEVMFKMKRYAAAVINTENGYFKSFKYSLTGIFWELAISYSYRILAATATAKD